MTNLIFGQQMDLLVNVDVNDLERAVRFYSTAFGLRIGRRFGTYGVEMLGSSVPIYLLLKEAGTPASNTTPQVRIYERHWTPTHLDFIVEEIKAAVQKAAQAGAGLRSQSPHINGVSWRSWRIHLVTDSVLCSLPVVATTKLPASGYWEAKILPSRTSTSCGATISRW